MWNSTAILSYNWKKFIFMFILAISSLDGFLNSENIMC